MAAGETATLFGDHNYSDGLVTAALAGTFMHELGHTLNLRHGGQDEFNYKPHYQSVMNYGYSVPLGGSSIEGAPLALLWHLDYSRDRASNASALNELMLNEQEGYGARWPLIFNSALHTHDPPVQLSAASPGAIDWNGNGVLDQEVVIRDITRWFETFPSRSSLI